MSTFERLCKDNCLAATEFKVGGEIWTAPGANKAEATVLCGTIAHLPRSLPPMECAMTNVKASDLKAIIQSGLTFDADCESKESKKQSRKTAPTPSVYIGQIRPTEPGHPHLPFVYRQDDDRKLIKILPKELGSSASVVGVGFLKRKKELIECRNTDSATGLPIYPDMRHFMKEVCDLDPLVDSLDKIDVERLVSELDSKKRRGKKDKTEPEDEEGASEPPAKKAKKSSSSESKSSSSSSSDKKKKKKKAENKVDLLVRVASAVAVAVAQDGDAMDTDDDESDQKDETEERDESEKRVKCYAIPVHQVVKHQEQGEALLKEHQKIWEKTIKWLSTFDAQISKSRKLKLKPKPATA